MKLAINIMKTVCRALFLMTALALLSCMSVPLIPEDMSAQELIQNGQSAFESGNYKASLRYFNAVIERYDDNPAVYVEAKYEIGHLYMKKKKYKSAVPILEEIRDLYPQVPPGTLPAAYEKLAKLELAKLTDEQLAKIHAELEKETAALAQTAAKDAESRETQTSNETLPPETPSATTDSNTDAAAFVDEPLPADETSSADDAASADNADADTEDAVSSDDAA